MPGRFIGPVQWRPLGEDRELMGAMQPLARAALGWLFNQIGPTGDRRGLWSFDLGPGKVGLLDALAIKDPDGFCRAFATIEVKTASWVEEFLDDSTEKKLRLEPGALCFNGTPLTLTFPIEVEQPYWLASYSGTTIPGSDPEKPAPLVGVLMTAQDLVPPIDWLVEDSWHGKLYPDLNALSRVCVLSGAWVMVSGKAQRYTGLARMWAEACLAAGRPLAERVPIGCSAVPGQLGLVLSPSGVPYALEVTASGLYAWRMGVSNLTSLLKTWVNAGTWSGDDAHLAMLYILADMIPVGERLTLLTAEDISVCYANTVQSGEEGSITIVLDDVGPPTVGSASNSSDSWNWYSSVSDGAKTILPYHGSMFHKSTGTPGVTNIHGFSSASGFGTLPDASLVYTWVYLPENSNPPTGIILRIFTELGTHNFYWGTLTGYDPKIRIGDLPPSGQWVMLAVPSAMMGGGTNGAQGKKLRGCQFGVRGASSNSCYWDEFGFRVEPEDTTFINSETLAGWQFSPTDNTLSVVTTHGLADAYLRAARISSLNTITISFSGEVPTASISHGSWCKYRIHPAFRFLFYEHPAIIGEWVRITTGRFWVGNSDCATEAPLWCTYDSDGVLRVRYYQRDRIETNNTTGDASLASCSGGASQSVASGGLQRVYGGMHWDGEDPPEFLYGSGTLRNSSWSLTGGSYGSVPNTILIDWSSLMEAWQYTLGGCGLCTFTPEYISGPAESVPDGYWGGFGVFYKESNYNSVVTVDTLNGCSGAQYEAWSSRFPDAIWACDFDFKVSGNRTLYECSGNKYSVGKIAYMIGNQPGEPPTINDWTIFQDSMAECYIMNTLDGTGMDCTSTSNISLPTTDRDGQCWLGETVWSGDPGESSWTPFNVEWGESVEATLAAYKSAHDSKIYLKYPNSTDWESDDIDPMLGSIFQSWAGG